jgi:hypothetical protein
MKTIFQRSHSKAVTTLTRFAILILVTAFLAGCGKTMSGTYVADGNSLTPYEKLNFTSGSKVELTHPVEGTIEATYVVEGDKVKITLRGTTIIWTIDQNGNLTNDGMFGKYTKQ